MAQHADRPAAGRFAFCDSALVFSPVARFSRVASRAETAPRTTITRIPLEGTAVSTTPNSDIRPEGARL